MEMYLYFSKLVFFSWETVGTQAIVGGYQVKPVNPTRIKGDYIFFNVLTHIHELAIG